MRAVFHRLLGHTVTIRPTLALIPAVWHICSCGKRWLA
jgi:hypothetical protein